MKLVNYTCTLCGHNSEEYFNDTEIPPDFLDDICDDCDGVGTLLINNVKTTVIDGTITIEVDQHKC